MNTLKKLWNIKIELLIVAISTIILVYGAVPLVIAIKRYMKLSLATVEILQIVTAVIALAVLYLGIKKWGSIKYGYSIEDASLKRFTIGIFGATAVSLLFSYIAYIVDMVVDNDLINQSNIISNIAEYGTADKVLYFLTAAAVAPIAEEILFRGTLFPSLQKAMSLNKAAVVTAMIFGVLHGTSLATIVDAAGIGLLMCYVYAAGRNLVECILIHGSYNGVAVLSVMRSATSEAGKTASDVETGLIEVAIALAIPIFIMGVVTIIAFRYFYKEANKKQIEQGCDKDEKE